ncbi:MAG: hypothetical protein ACK4FP_09515 [Azonexus sp.]
MLNFSLPADAFGDRFELSSLPLPRPPAGYAVQRLDTDQVLDRRTGALLPVRSPGLDALFDSFEAAHEAAGHWVRRHCTAGEDHHLAIVPAGYDRVLERPILIYGVLCTQP